jgi:hypothetical protein
VIKRYNNLSFLFFIPGVIIQIAGFVLNKDQPPDSFSTVALILLVAGTALAVTGFGYYAKAKGRSPAWGLAGFLGILGLLVLALLKDRSGDPWNT